MALGLTIKIVMTFKRDKYILGDPEVDLLGGREVIGWAKIGYKQVLKTFFFTYLSFIGINYLAKGLWEISFTDMPRVALTFEHIGKIFPSYLSDKILFNINHAFRVLFAVLSELKTKTVGLFLIHTTLWYSKQCKG